MQRGLAATVLAFLVLPASTPAQASRQASRPASALTETALRDHVRVLAADGMRGREAGSPACRVAGAYLALQLSANGIAPAGTEGYFQPFEIRGGYRISAPARLTLLGAKARVELAEGKDFTVLGHTGSGEAAGKLVFAGFGVSQPRGPHGTEGWDDYEGRAVAGRIVVLVDGAPEIGGVKLRDNPGAKVYTAKLAGAAGVLLVDPALGAPPRPYTPARDSAGIPAMRVSLAALERACPGSADAILSYVDGDGDGPDFDAESRMGVSVEKTVRAARNVVGQILGADPALRGEFVVLGAHYDHLGLGGEGSLAPGSGVGQIHNGADDNASGTAVVVEVAKALAARRVSLRRSVLVVCFSGEEKGLLGSRWFVEHPTVPREEIVAMVNLDMVGRSKKGAVNVLDAGTSPAFQKLLAGKEGLRISLGDSAFGGSDHQSFVSAGIPALHFFTGAHSDYHRPSDDTDKLDFAGMRTIGETVLDLVAGLSQLDERPAFVAPKPRKVPAGQSRAPAGARPYLGTIPDYVEDERGVKLSGVTPGSPVAAAGLKAEDILVGIGDTKIANIYDFSAALQGLEPGMKIDVAVLRGGKRKVFRVTVGKR